MNDELPVLPFDVDSRYRLAADCLALVREADAPLRLLDVGGGSDLLRRFVDDPVVVVDAAPGQGAGLVRGDGCRLPFVEGSFDVVLAIDALEHVPPGARSTFVAECVRVARGHVVLIGPCADPRIDEAETLLQRFLAQKLGRTHDYLEEHRTHGLPQRAEVEDQLRALGARTAALGHGNLERWLAAVGLWMFLDADLALHPLRDDFSRFCRCALQPDDWTPPAYRHLIVAALGSAPLPDLERLRQDARPVTSPVGELADPLLALLAFDRERARWRQERQDLVREIRRLEGEQARARSELGTRSAERTASPDSPR